MRIDFVASVLAIALSLVVFTTAPESSNRIPASGVSQDSTWTVVEYPEGQEVTVELKAGASLADAKGTARVLRNGNETTINVEVSGLTGNENTHQIYLIDSLGNASVLGSLTIADGSGTLQATTPLSKFMIVVSPQADLTAIDSQTVIAFRSAVPGGLNVIAREEQSATESAATTSVESTASIAEPEPSRIESPEYDVPLLGIESLRRGANTSMRAKFSQGFEATKASVLVKAQKNGPTQIKMRLMGLRQAPEGTQYALWQVGPDNSYTLLGRLSPSARRGESVITAESTASDFGLLITFENAEANTPAGSMVATIIR